MAKYLITVLPLFTLAMADYNNPPANIKLTPPDLDLLKNMHTTEQYWYDHMIGAYTQTDLQKEKWGKFDVLFNNPHHLNIQVFKWAEGGYESPGDCWRACEWFFSEAVKSRVDHFQCDHRPGGNTHCWMGYAPKVGPLA